MGNQREIRQVAPRDGLGVVIPIRAGCTPALTKVLGGQENCFRFYTYKVAAGEAIAFPNLDGPDITLAPQSCDHLVIQSGGKMWCGYEAFVEHVRTLAPFLANAHFFVGDEEDYIDEFRLSDGVLHYRRVHEGGWVPVDEFIRSINL